MADFDDELGPSDVHLTPAEGAVGMILWTRGVDPSPDREELHRIARRLAGEPPLAHLDEAKLRAILEKVHRIAAEEGDGALLDRAAIVVPREHRSRVLEIATALASETPSGGRDAAERVDVARLCLGLPDDAAPALPGPPREGPAWG